MGQTGGRAEPGVAAQEPVTADLARPDSAGGRPGPDGHGELSLSSGGPPDRRMRARWTRVLGLGAGAFAVWLLLFAPTLQHNAQVSPVGTRRTVSLDLVGPVAALSRGLGLSHIVSATGRSNRLPGGTEGLVAAGPVGDRPGHPRASQNPAPGATTTTTVPPNPKEPTAAAPLRVLIVGDSIGLDMGGALQSDLAGTGVVNAGLDGRES